MRFLLKKWQGSTHVLWFFDPLFSWIRCGIWSIHRFFTQSSYRCKNSRNTKIYHFLSIFQICQKFAFDRIHSSLWPPYSDIFSPTNLSCRCGNGQTWHRSPFWKIIFHSLRRQRSHCGQKMLIVGPFQRSQVLSEVICDFSGHFGTKKISNFFTLKPRGKNHPNQKIG